MNRMICFLLVLCAMQAHIQAQETRNNVELLDILLKPSKEKVAYEKYVKELPLPKIAFVKKEDYPVEVKRLGYDDRPQIAILREEYRFTDFNGREHKIPAGTIFDGASPPQFAQGKNAPVTIGPIKNSELLGKVVNAFSPDHFNVLNYGSFMPNVIAAALIHDWSYRNPDKFSKADADLRYLFDLERSGAPAAIQQYAGVLAFGGTPYDEHKARRARGDYKVFTDEHYALSMEKLNNPDNRLPWIRDRVLLIEGMAAEDQEKVWNMQKTAYESTYNMAMPEIADLIDLNVFSSAKSQNTMNAKKMITRFSNGSGNTGNKDYSGKALPLSDDYNRRSARETALGTTDHRYGSIVPREADTSRNGLATLRKQQENANALSTLPQTGGTSALQQLSSILNEVTGAVLQQGAVPQASSQGGSAYGGSTDWAGIWDSAERDALNILRQNGVSEADINGARATQQYQSLRNNVRNRRN